MSLRYAVLGLLATRPSSGYDLLKTFRESLANVWPATQSQLYTELNRLAETGLVAVTAAGARGRKEYAVTDAGRAELTRWLVDAPPDVSRRNDMLLRVFFLGLVDPAQAEEFLRERAERADRLHDELAGLAGAQDWTDGPLAVYGRLALEWGLRMAAMQRDWAEWAAAEVARLRTDG